jgi:hypothetical protein
VLPTHPHHVAAALPGAQQQFERQSRLAADPMVRSELRDFAFGPGYSELCAVSHPSAESVVISDDSEIVSGGVVWRHDQLRRTQDLQPF